MKYILAAEYIDTIDGNYFNCVFEHSQLQLFFRDMSSIA